MVVINVTQFTIWLFFHASVVLWFSFYGSFFWVPNNNNNNKLNDTDLLCIGMKNANFAQL